MELVSSSVGLSSLLLGGASTDSRMRRGRLALAVGNGSDGFARGVAGGGSLVAGVWRLAVGGVINVRIPTGFLRCLATVAKGVALAALFSLSMVANPLPSFADGKFGQQILFIVDINLRITYLSLLKRRPNQ